MPLPINRVQEGEIKFDGVFDIFDTQYCMLYIAGTRGMPLELDYVRIWQHGGDAPEAPAPETPDTGASSAIPALATLLTASAAALAITRKRK